MKWKFLLLSMFFSKNTNAEPALLLHQPTITDQLKNLNISLNPLTISSSKHITGIDEKKSENEVSLTTKGVIRALTNSMTFCKLVVATQKISSDNSNTLVDLKVEEVPASGIVRADGIYRAGHIFTSGEENTILLRKTEESNHQEHAYAFAHETDHLFWSMLNLAQSKPEDRVRVSNRWADIKLTRKEVISAPYNSDNKHLFKMALLEGESKMGELMGMIDGLNSSLSYTLLDPVLKDFINCLEEEAKLSPFVQLSNKLWKNSNTRCSYQNNITWHQMLAPWSYVLLLMASFATVQNYLIIFLVNYVNTMK